MIDFNATIIIHEPMFPFKRDRAKSIKVIAFDKEGRILGIKRSRTFDIISGRQEWDDDTYEQAARREAYEQADVTLGAVTLAAVIEIPSQTGEPSTFELVITGFIKKIIPRSEEQEHRRAFLDKETFLKRYRFGKPEDMKTLIDMAEFVFEQEQSPPHTKEGAGHK